MHRHERSTTTTAATTTTTTIIAIIITTIILPSLLLFNAKVPRSGQSCPPPSRRGASSWPFETHGSASGVLLGNRGTYLIGMIAFKV